jgi:hypothetical protein
MDTIKEILSKNISVNSVSDPQNILISVILKQVIERKVNSKIYKLAKELQILLDK